MANCMREVDEKREISLLWPYIYIIYSLNIKLTIEN